MKKIPRRLQGAPYRLTDLLDKAVLEGEKIMHIFVNYNHIREYADTQFHGDDVRINVGYFHEGEKREVTAYRILCENSYGTIDLRVQDARNEIERKGLGVGVVSNRRHRFNLNP